MVPAVVSRSARATVWVRKNSSLLRSAGYNGSFSTWLSELQGLIMLRCETVLAARFILLAMGASSVTAREPGWVRNVIPRPAERRVLRSTPIIHRPYRPLHIYGNTVRRQHYHGRLLPVSS